jgi:hypothetical protein
MFFTRGFTTENTYINGLEICQSLATKADKKQRHLGKKMDFPHYVLVSHGDILCTLLLQYVEF